MAAGGKRYKTTELTTTNATLLAGIKAPLARPANSRFTLEIWVTGTFTSVAISAKPNSDAAAIPMVSPDGTALTFTEPGCATCEISADEYYAQRTGGTGATVYARLVG
jgi:hypothetical protein